MRSAHCCGLRAAARAGRVRALSACRRWRGPAHLVQVFAHVEIGASGEQGAGVLARRRALAQIVEPVELRLAAARYEARREKLAESRISATPAQPHYVSDGTVHLAPCRVL